MLLEAVAASLVNIIVLLLFGLLIVVALEKYKSEKILMSNMVVLLLLGIMLSATSGRSLFFKIDQAALAAFSTIALAIAILDATFSLKFSELDSSYRKAMLRFLVFFTLNLILLTATSLIFFKEEFAGSIFLAVIFSILMTAISPSICFTKADKYISKIKPHKGRVFNSLRTEALIGLPFALLLPFIIAGVAQQPQPFFAESVSLFSGILIGLSTGLVVGILVIVLIRSKYSEQLSSLILVIAAIISYAITEQLNGNGLIAIATIGLFYSSIYVKNRSAILEHSSAAMFILELVVLTMVAFTINVNISWGFIIKTLALFLIYLVIRFTAVVISMMPREKSHLDNIFINSRSRKHADKAHVKELIFWTLHVPKDISVVIAIMALANFPISGMDSMLSIALYFVILSHLVSLAAIKKTECFFDNKTAPFKKAETVETKVKLYYKN